MLAEHAEVTEPGRPAGQRRVGELGIHRRVVEAVQLEGKEDQVGRDGGDALGNGLVELAELGVSAVAAEQQRSERHEASQDFLDALVVEQGVGHFGAGQVGEMTLEARLEGNGGAVGLGEVALEFRAIEAGVEIRQVPFGQGVVGRNWGGHWAGALAVGGTKHLVPILWC